MTEPKLMYYTYVLVDPRCGSVFYVGKGKDDRRFAHMKEARKGTKGRKCDRIRAILEAGAEPEARIVKEYTDELEAYAAEADLIDSYGLANLTNATIGGLGRVTPPDPRKDARKIVTAARKVIARSLHLRALGYKVLVGTEASKFDILEAACEMADSLRNRAGESWFDRTVGVV